ncbi:CHAD domain-containing protein [Nitrincola sp. A-D6]|uniref:CHAD domain-containing protein n=1 Tax=Nitrincola sp. A-D6 TaxID=1545442 RepID=UPI000690EE99|nr:CHAD domain-containing protein [Nitrincola sp. A-D6]
MSDELLPALRLYPETDHWHFPELHQLVMKQRDLARDALMSHPDLQQQGRLILLLVTELHALEAPEHEKETLKSFVKQQLNSLRKRVHKRYRKALKGEVDDLHQLRIALKPLRYALEFFMTMLPASKTLPEYDAVLTAVRALGQVNDMAMAGRILTGLTSADTHLQTAQAYMAGLQSARLEEQRKVALLALK